MQNRVFTVVGNSEKEAFDSYLKLENILEKSTQKHSELLSLDVNLYSIEEEKKNLRLAPKLRVERDSQLKVFFNKSENNATLGYFKEKSKVAKQELNKLSLKNDFVPIYQVQIKENFYNQESIITLFEDIDYHKACIFAELFSKVHFKYPKVVTVLKEKEYCIDRIQEKLEPKKYSYTFSWLKPSEIY